MRKAIFKRHKSRPGGGNKCPCCAPQTNPARARFLRDLKRSEKHAARRSIEDDIIESVTEDEEQ